MPSPLKFKEAQTAPTQIGLDKARHNLIRDLDETVPEIPTTFFYDNLLPPSPLPANKTVKDVVSTLAREGKIVGGNWEGWKRPSAYTELEDVVFRKFAKLTDNIRKASGIKKKLATVEFRCNPAFTLTSKTRNNSSKPDCYGIRTNAQFGVDGQTGTTQPRWLDVAVPGEFKKKSDEGGAYFKDVSVCSALYYLLLGLMCDLECCKGSLVYESPHAGGCASSFCHRLHYRGRQHAAMVLQPLRCVCLSKV